MRYAEHAPPDSLSTVLHCLWTFEDGGGAREPQRIVPDGRCELVVHLGDPYLEVGSDAPQPRVLFAGQLTRPLWLVATGRSRVIGARFRPAAARAFVGGSMRRTTDRRLSIDEIQPGLAFGVVETLARKADGDQLESLAAWIGDRIAQRATMEDLAVRAAAERIEQSGGEVDVAGIVAASGLGRRTLERRFADAVGISPLLLANVFRFRRVFDALERDSARPWTDAATVAGYYDQSHLIRDFRRFVGCTPTEFAATSPGLGTALVE